MRSKSFFLTFSRKDQLNALYLASRNGHLKKIKYLLTLPAVRENAASSHNLALRLASENGHLEVVRFLLQIPEVMADAAASDNHALRYAAENGHLLIVKLLLMIPLVRERAAINANHALRWTSANGHLDIVNCLLEIDFVSNYADANDNQALKYAVKNNHHKVASRLLKVPAVLEYMRENQPGFVADNQRFFDQMLEKSRARVILSRKLSQQKLTHHKLPFDIIVKILENRSHAAICDKSNCNKTCVDGQPYCNLVYNYARRVTARATQQNTSNIITEVSKAVVKI